MDRQAWIAVTLCVIGLVAWQWYFTVKYPVHPATAAVSSASPASDPALAETSSAPGAPGTGQVTGSQTTKEGPAPAPASVETAPEKIETVLTPQIELRFTNLGGGIADAIPLGRQHLGENGINVQLNAAGQIPIGALSETAGRDANLPYTVTREGNTVHCERTGLDGLKIDKDYTLDWQGDEHQIPAIDLKLTFTNTGAQPYKNSGYFLHAGSAAPIHQHDLGQYLSFDWLTGGHYHTDHATSFDAGHIPLVGYETRAARAEIVEPVDKATWVAVKNQFYVTIVAPLAPAAGAEAPAREVWARRFDVPQTAADLATGQARMHGIDVALGLPAVDLAPGASATHSFQIYAGPKYYSRLDKLGHNEQEVMDFGKFKVVSITLLGLMNTFKGWFGSYGIAIIVLTVLVKTVLFPLQNKAQQSMKRMSLLSPKVAELKERYKDDAARLNQETMKLYKTYGVSPVGGCWPMLIQMPIFFGFLYMLYTAAELRNSSFLWVKDLSQPDTIGHLLGFPINILPILMVGSQFWQMQLTPKTGDPQQQKMMMFMPLLFGFFCYNFAAALALYYSMQGLLTILQLYITRNQAPPTLEEGGAKPTPARGGSAGGFTGFGSRGAFGSGNKKGASRRT